MSSYVIVKHILLFIIGGSLRLSIFIISFLCNFQVYHVYMYVFWVPSIFMIAMITSNLEARKIIVPYN